MNTLIISDVQVNTRIITDVQVNTRIITDVQVNTLIITDVQVNTLIITDVHARDLVERFQQDGVADARDFAWESQLRFYWDRSLDGVVIRQCNGARFTSAVSKSLPEPGNHATITLPAPGNHGNHYFACSNQLHGLW